MVKLHGLFRKLKHWVLSNNYSARDEVEWQI